MPALIWNSRILPLQRKTQVDPRKNATPPNTMSWKEATAWCNSIPRKPYPNKAVTNPSLYPPTPGLAGRAHSEASSFFGLLPASALFFPAPPPRPRPFPPPATPNPPTPPYPDQNSTKFFLSAPARFGCLAPRPPTSQPSLWTPDPPPPTPPPTPNPVSAPLGCLSTPPLPPTPPIPTRIQPDSFFLTIQNCQSVYPDQNSTKFFLFAYPPRSFWLSGS